MARAYALPFSVYSRFARHLAGCYDPAMPSAMTHSYAAAIYLAARLGHENWYHDHPWLSSKFISRQCPIDESIRSLVS